MVDIIGEVLESLEDKQAQEANKAKLATIRKKIMETPLEDEVVENLKTFLDAMPDNTSVAVRSSGSAEDLASQSFAGPYDTFLYKSTLDEVVESVKACWASMFKDSVLDYAFNTAFLASADNDLDEPATFSNVRAPKMAVLIM